MGDRAVLKSFCIMSPIRIHLQTVRTYHYKTENKSSSSNCLQSYEKVLAKLFRLVCFVWTQLYNFVWLQLAIRTSLFTKPIVHWAQPCNQHRVWTVCIWSQVDLTNQESTSYSLVTNTLKKWHALSNNDWDQQMCQQYFCQVELNPKTKPNLNPNLPL